MDIPWALATSGGRENATATLRLIGMSSEPPIVTRDEVPFAKPDPHLFLAAAARLDVAIENAIVVEDSVWDMPAAQRARALGVGLLSGAMDARSSRQRGRFESTKIRRTCSCASTSWESAAAVTRVR